VHLVQLLLPLRDNRGEPFASDLFAAVARELTARHGGVTAYSRAPAEGLWSEGERGGVARDDVVVYEVMVERLDAAAWGEYRRELQQRFAQEELVVRALLIERL
jgi:hypothetical protein